MQKWEYKVTEILNNEALNKMGGEGWELVGVLAADYGESRRLIFKRPVSS